MRFKLKENKISMTFVSDIFDKLLQCKVQLADLNLPKTAAVNSSSYQVDKGEFICLTCGTKLSSKTDFLKHTMSSSEGK